MSQEKHFAVGETVSLNSGGRLMTVLSIERETITCAWSAREDIKTKSFPVRALKEAKEERTLEQMLMAIYAGRDLRREQAAASHPLVKAAKQAYDEVYAKVFAEAGGENMSPEPAS
jgi:uncharacterized protein YodC (DUF2158 family)